MAAVDPNSEVSASCGPPRDAGDWKRLLECVGIPALLIAIEDRMGDRLRAKHAAEDVLQESLLHAWRDLGKLEWRGTRAFRSWLLTIIDHRIRDLADREGAAKRGGAATVQTLGYHAPGGEPPPAELAATTTPSRVAVYREEAEAMRRALLSVPEDCREVVRLRLFERLPVEQIATRLEIGASAVRHRFRRGAVIYEQALRESFLSRSGPETRPPAARRCADSATE